MKNQISKVLFIVGLAIILQACKKESISTLDSNKNIENPQSMQIINHQNEATSKIVDMKDLAGAATPYNYPLDSFQILVTQGEKEVEPDSTKPKIRRGVIITLGNDIRPIYTQGTNIRYKYNNALSVYLSGQWYSIIREDMIESIIVE